LLIGRNERHAFCQSLSQQDAIEWIFVERWQCIDAGCVFAGDRKLSVSVVQQSLTQSPGIDAKVFSAQCTFDRDFPNAGSTEDEFVF